MNIKDLSNILGYGLIVIGIVFLMNAGFIGALFIGLGVGYLARPFIQKTFFLS